MKRRPQSIELSFLFLKVLTAIETVNFDSMLKVSEAALTGADV